MEVVKKRKPVSSQEHLNVRVGKVVGNNRRLSGQKRPGKVRIIRWSRKRVRI